MFAIIIDWKLENVWFIGDLCHIFYLIFLSNWPQFKPRGQKALFMLNRAEYEIYLAKNI